MGHFMDYYQPLQNGNVPYNDWSLLCCTMPHRYLDHGPDVNFVNRKLEMPCQSHIPFHMESPLDGGSSEGGNSNPSYQVLFMITIDDRVTNGCI